MTGRLSRRRSYALARRCAGARAVRHPHATSGASAVLSTSPAPSRPACAQMRVLLASAARPAAYVRLHYMSSDTTRALAAALRRAEADRCLGVIIDLRNNPGARALPPALAALGANR
jgi:hypothetical protein